VRSRWKAVLERERQPPSVGYECSWSGTVDDREWTFSVQVEKPPNIVDSYRRELAGIVDTMEEADETTTFSPVYAFPAGDEGFFVHETDYSKTGRIHGAATAIVRAGDLEVTIQLRNPGHDPSHRGLVTKDIALREFAAVLSGLG
jgi:hypothetical protein